MAHGKARQMIKGNPIFNPPTQNQSMEMGRKGPRDSEMRQKEAPNLMSHKTMNKKVVYRLFFFYTYNTFIHQIPTSTLEMIEGQNFIQIHIPKEKETLEGLPRIQMPLWGK